MSLLGVDVGTTAVKCAVVRAAADHELLAASYVALGDVPTSSDAGAQVAVQGEQQVEQVLLAVHRAIAALPLEHREQISSIGICGQMHGIVWWRSSSVEGQLQKLSASCEHDSESSDTVQQQQQEQPAWSKLITWQDQRCSPAFLERCNNDIRQNASASGASSSPLATGYGLATYAHTLANAPESLEGFDACGTIQDFVAFALCGHHSPVDATIDTTNGFSWGGFDLQNATWNKQTKLIHHVAIVRVEALKIPFEMLPTVKKPGEIIGHVATDMSFGLPNGTPVYIPIGDHPSSVVAALLQHQQANHRPQLETNLTLVNFGTSAQLAMLLSADEVVEVQNASKSFEIRPFLFENQFVGVAASLSGGNIYAWFVKQCQDWIRELQMTPTDSQQQHEHDDAHWYKRLIDLGMAKVDTELIFAPALNGERADPSMRGSIQQLCMTNWSLGDISTALCNGLIDNLFGMVPRELQASVSTRKMIGTGSALVRNELLRYFLASRLSDPLNQLQIQNAADAAIGAALAPVLLQ